MSVTPLQSRAAILVKAIPHPSKIHGETVCCAGITADGIWQRLYPIRFRHLSGKSAFKRWDWVSFRYSRPSHDDRKESCCVHEESIAVEGAIPKSDQADFLKPLVVDSINTAISKGASLALIRPKNTTFRYRRKSVDEVKREKESYVAAAAQKSMFDKELAALDPTPYEFRFRFEDDTPHNFRNEDWEVHAMYYNARRRGWSDKETLDWMDEKFNVQYPTRGMLFAVGNQVTRRQTWMLLGVIRVDQPAQNSFSF